MKVSLGSGAPSNTLTVEGQVIRFMGQRQRAMEIIEAVTAAQENPPAFSAARP